MSPRTGRGFKMEPFLDSMGLNSSEGGRCHTAPLKKRDTVEGEDYDALAAARRARRASKAAANATRGNGALCHEYRSLQMNRSSRSPWI